MSNIENTKIIKYMFEQLQEAVENNDEVEALEIQNKLHEFGFDEESIKALEIIKLNFNHE